MCQPSFQSYIVYFVFYFFVQTKIVMSIHIDSIAKKIRKTLNGRGSSRFQMQIPYGRSAIIFLQCKNNPSLSTLWTNLLLHIILADLKSSRPGHVFFPQNAVEQNNMLIHELDTFFEQQTSLSSEQFQQMLTKSKRKNTWGDGLVSLPTIFNIDKKTREGIDGSREARVPTRAILRLMATDVSQNTLPTTSIQKLDQLIMVLIMLLIIFLFH